jgi:glycosyltransferase involved in cell wall biosynthesis
MDEFSPVSVVVCTRDRSESLRLTLQSLAEQELPPLEVVVVDQSRGAETRAAVLAARDSIDRLQYLHLREPGLSRAYNAGIRATRAHIVAFTDDDCVAPPCWLAAIAGAFEEHAGVGLLYGQVLVPPDLRERENVDGVTPSLTIERRRTLGPGERFEVFGMGANFAGRRSVLLRLGGFDEVLGGGAPLASSQDFDLEYRAFKKGERTLLEPDVWVHHRGFRSHAELRGVVRSYGIGVGGFYAKHVRLGDGYAAWLLGAHLLRAAARVLKRVATRRPARVEAVYLLNLFAGMVRSFSFQLDRGRSVYRTRPAGEPR